MEDQLSLKQYNKSCNVYKPHNAHDIDNFLFIRVEYFKFYMNYY